MMQCDGAMASGNIIVGLLDSMSGRLTPVMECKFNKE